MPLPALLPGLRARFAAWASGLALMVMATAATAVDVLPVNIAIAEGRSQIHVSGSSVIHANDQYGMVRVTLSGVPQDTISCLLKLTKPSASTIFSLGWYPDSSTLQIDRVLPALSFSLPSADVSSADMVLVGLSDYRFSTQFILDSAANTIAFTSPITALPNTPIQFYRGFTPIGSATVLSTAQAFTPITLTSPLPPSLDFPIYRVPDGEDLYRVTFKKSRNSVDIRIIAQAVPKVYENLGVAVIGYTDPLTNNRTTTSGNQGVSLQFISDQIAARMVVVSPDVRESNGSADPQANLAQPRNFGSSRIWFGPESWDPSSGNGTVGQRVAASSLTTQSRFITQVLNLGQEGFPGVASLADFNVTYRFGGARYNGPGVAYTAGIVADILSAVEEDVIKVSPKAYRRTTEWGANQRKKFALSSNVLSAFSGDLSVVTKLTITLAGDVVVPLDKPNGSSAGPKVVTLYKKGYHGGIYPYADEFSLQTVGGATQVNLLNGGYGIQIGDSVELTSDLTFAEVKNLKISGFNYAADLAMPTYVTGGGNGNDRILAGNEYRLNLDYFTVEPVDVPADAKNVLAFFPNIQGKDAVVYYDSPNFVQLNADSSAPGKTQIQVTTEAVGRPVAAGKIAINPTILTLNWGLNQTPPTLAPDEVAIGSTTYTLAPGSWSDAVTYLKLTLPATTKSGPVLTRGGLTGQSAKFKRVAVDVGTATIQYADLANPNNDPLHYSATAINHGEPVHIWYTPAKSTIFTVDVVAAGTIAKITVGGQDLFAVKGKDGTNPTTADFTIAGNKITLVKELPVSLGDVVLYYLVESATDSKAKPTAEATKGIITDIPATKLQTSVSEPVLYPKGATTLALNRAGKAILPLVGDHAVINGKLYVLQGSSLEDQKIEPRAQYKSAAWDGGMEYIVLPDGGIGTVVLRDSSVAERKIITHYKADFPAGLMTFILGKMSSAKSFYELYPVPDKGDPANGVFQGGDYVDFLLGPNDDGAVEGKEQFTLTLRANTENNGFEILDPQSATFTIWDNDSTLTVQVSRGATILVAKAAGTTPRATVASNAQIVFNLTAPIPINTAINYSISEPATAVLKFGIDYTIGGAVKVGNEIRGTIPLQAGTTQASLEIIPLDGIVARLDVASLSSLKLLVQENPSYALGGSSGNPDGVAVSAGYEVKMVSNPGGGGGGSTTEPGGTGSAGSQIDDANSNGKGGCGAGSSIGLLSLTAFLYLRTTRRRRSLV